MIDDFPAVGGNALYLDQGFHHDSFNEISNF